MAISERIHFFRNLRRMTQKYLGLQLGFPDNSADVRMAQYETGSRTPKADITAALAQVLDVAPEALNVPDIDSYIALAHTFFALEDIYGITVSEADGELCLKVMPTKARMPQRLSVCLPLGTNRKPNSIQVRSTRKPTTNGAITIPCSIQRADGLKFLPKNSAMLWSKRSKTV